MKQGRKMFRLIKKSLKDFKITQENNQGNAYKVLSVFRFHQNRILGGIYIFKAWDMCVCVHIWVKVTN